MSKVIAISGAQNTGKTTILNSLIELDWHVDNFKVSRAIQAEWGKTLSEIVEFEDSMINFQEEVIKRKFENDLALVNDGKNDIVLTERSFADIAAYAFQWVQESENDLYAWFASYKERCKKYQSIYSSIILLNSFDSIKFEDDPNRDKKENQAKIDRHLRTYLEEFGVNVIEIKESSNKARITYITRALADI
ncbi:MAG: AAA family ATPase [Candidatus Nitrosotenuis sp.]